MDKEKLFAQIKGGLIVSCQALETEPLYTKEGGVMPLMAKPRHERVLWASVPTPCATSPRSNRCGSAGHRHHQKGLPRHAHVHHRYHEGSGRAGGVRRGHPCRAGTGALRPDGSTSAQFIRAIKAKYPDQLVMADCDNFENAMACAEAGADFVGTTMRGYTPETKGIDDIDFDFVHKLAAECPAKVIAEGHIHYPEQAVKALEAGAFALVVGGAITRPAEITARFTGAINAAKK